MPRVDLVVESPMSSGHRVRQLEGMFDVPRADTSRLEWHGDVPIDDDAWQVGLIVGPSGCGKSSLLRQLFGPPIELTWGAPSVVEDFAPTLSMTDIVAVCQAVGFNTIPAWMRPHAVLSGGEKFRAMLARQLLESPGVVVVDEFTSVVDRQVAKIGAHAVQKYVRRRGSRFVAASCHYDIIEWLQPDWILEPTSMQLSRRALQRRPRLDVSVSPVPYAAWRMFAPFHYLTTELHCSSRCYGLFVRDRIAAFAGLLPRPISNGKQKGQCAWGVSRLVTLPDWQGLGLAMCLVDTLGAAHRAVGRRLRTYPAHPSLVRAFDKSAAWTMAKPPGRFLTNSSRTGLGFTGGRPCATFEYVGAEMPDGQAARRLLRA